MPYLLNGDFIGQKPNNTLFYSGQDSYKNYIKNLETMPSSWYYKDKQITYIHNEFGHRCNSINLLNQDDYILFTGCSHTEGIGLELEKTYAYKLAGILNKPYYNLALGGSGLDTMLYNLSVWLNTYKTPKLIIIQWPEITRFLGREFNNLQSMGSWLYDMPKVQKFYLSALKINYFENKAWLQTKQILNLIKNIPNLHLNFQEKRDFFPTDTLPIDFKLDKARDNGHNGIQMNDWIADRLYNIYSDKYFNATVHSTN